MKETIDKQDRVRGILKVEKKLKGTDEWELEYIKLNLVVNNAKYILRDAMFGDTNKLISKMIFGNQNLTLSSDLINVPAPSASNTNLINKLYEKPTTKSKNTYDASPSIDFVAILEESEMNGANGQQIITEFGLVNNNNEMFSIKTRSAILKDANISLKFTWSIIFS
jgi:hypothetical protein